MRAVTSINKTIVTVAAGVGTAMPRPTVDPPPLVTGRAWVGVPPRPVPPGLAYSLPYLCGTSGAPVLRLHDAAPPEDSLGVHLRLYPGHCQAKGVSCVVVLCTPV